MIYDRRIGTGNYHLYSLKELESIPDPDLKQQLLFMYFECISDISSEKAGKIIAGQHPGESLDTIYTELEKFEYRNRSETISPGGVVIMYNPIIKRKSRKPFTCPVCRDRFIKPTRIAVYKPFLWDITNKRRVFVLKKPIIVNEYCASKLPDSIGELEDLQNRLDLAYEIGDDDAYSTNIHLNGGLHVMRLGRGAKNNIHKTSQV